MSTKADKFHVVNSALGAAALLEQLAEESTELAHAALKQARIERDENPTPVSVLKSLRGGRGRAPLHPGIGIHDWADGYKRD